MKNYILSFFAGIVLALLFILPATCNRQPDATKTTTTTDTTAVWKPDTLHTPAVPEPEEVNEPPSPGLQVLQERYEHYKRLANALRTELDSLSGVDCDSLARRLTDLKEKLKAAGELVELLSRESGDMLSLKRYAFNDTTDTYIHFAEIKTNGILPPGGYKYRTDVLQKAVTTTVTTDNFFLKKNALGLLAGLQTDGRRVYGLQYERTGKTFGFMVQPAWIQGGEGQLLVGGRVGF